MTSGIDGRSRRIADVADRSFGRLNWAESCRCAATIGRHDSPTSAGDLLCPLYVESRHSITRDEQLSEVLHLGVESRQLD